MEHDQTTATDDIVACLKIIKDLNRKKDVLDAFEDLKALSKGHSRFNGPSVLTKCTRSQQRGHRSSGRLRYPPRPLIPRRH